MENGYHLYSLSGELLREEHIEKFKQWLWRPRPPTLLTREDQKTIRKNLRDYSKDFDELDRIEEDKEKGAVVEERRRMLSEWLAWRASTEEELRDERKELGLDEGGGDGEKSEEADGEGEQIEELVEEGLDEVEEIVS